MIVNDLYERVISYRLREDDGKDHSSSEQTGRKHSTYQESENVGTLVNAFNCMAVGYFFLALDFCTQVTFTYDLFYVF